MQEQTPADQLFTIAEKDSEHKSYGLKKDLSIDGTPE